jgi:hypothetical protein
MNANASIDVPIGDDLISEAKKIAEFWDMPERKCRYMMETGQLPGAFRLGGRWFQSKSAAREDIRARALAPTAKGQGR